MLNEKLLRISRERANSDRGVQPKKEHDGYIVLRSEQWYDTVKTSHPEKGYERYSEEFLAKYNLLRTEVQNVDAWKTVIQTPYSTKLTYDQAEHEIQSDLEWEVLDDLGVKGCRSISINAVLATNNPGNICYKYRLRAEYRTGYWEVDCYTLGPVTVSLNRYLLKKRLNS